MTCVKVKGIQKTAIQISAAVKFKRYLYKAVLEPFIKTQADKEFPAKAREAVKR